MTRMPYDVIIPLLLAILASVAIVGFGVALATH